MDSTSRTQTEVKTLHLSFILSWCCLLFMVYKMNLPHRGVSPLVLPLFVLLAVCVVASGSRVRRQLFARSTQSLRDDAGKALGLWRGANVVGFTHAMSLSILGAVLKFLGTSWLVAGVFFSAGLGLLVLWRPHQMAESGTLPT